jgi:hypothetical protein
MERNPETQRGYLPTSWARVARMRVSDPITPDTCPLRASDRSLAVASSGFPIAGARHAPPPTRIRP